MKNRTVSRTKCGKYFVSNQVKVAITEPSFAGGTVGIDLGLWDFATLSSGEKNAPPQHYRKAQQKRGRLARQLSRKKSGSHNREKTRLRLSRQDERIANQRRDFHHKLSRQLVEENQCIGLEDLNIQGIQCEAQLRTLSFSKIHWRCGLVSIHRNVGVQRGLVWLPNGKSQPMVSILKDLFCLWYSHALHSAASPPAAVPCCYVVHDRDVKCNCYGSCHSGIHILSQTTVGATESNAGGQPVRPVFAAAAGQRWTNQEANQLSRLVASPDGWYNCT